MDIKLHSSDRFRISTNQGNNFIDINGLTFEAGIAIDLYSFCHYIELRKKEGFIRLFLWESKRHKHEIEEMPQYADVWWKDAEVIFSLNDRNK